MNNNLKGVFSDVLSFLTNHLFIATTGTAALIHSTWSLATFFNGTEPPPGSWSWLFWVTPALLLAISIDVGQIATSSQIANGQRTPWKYGTFAVLAVATYYLQWLYLANHLPLIALGAGVNPNVVPFAIGVRDIALWALPGLLPASTLLYTFSYGSVKRQRKESVVAKQVVQNEVTIEKTVAKALPNPSTPQIAASANSANAGFAISCDDCDWKAIKETQRSATNSLIAHRRHRHPAPVFSSNGHNKEQ